MVSILPRPKIFLYGKPESLIDDHCCRTRQIREDSPKAGQESG